MKRLVKTVLPIILLAGAVAAAVMLIKTRPIAAKNEPPVQFIKVEIETAASQSKQVVVQAKGTVVPARAMVIQPEVGGKIVFQSKNLVPGGKVRAGEVLARVDKRDYALVLDQHRAAVSQAELQLKMEQQTKSVAEYEWQLVREKDRPKGQGKALTLRDPQLSNVKAQLAAARSGLEQAKLNLKRTAIRAPFNGMIREESAEMGQLVTPQSRLATLVGTDAFWVQISVPVEELDWISIPGSTAGQGSTATIRRHGGRGGSNTRQGQVVRLLGDLDPRGRMAQLVISVADPLSLASETEQTPLLLGAYVSVEIAGDRIVDAVGIPRSALRNGNQVWILNDDQRLEIRDVQVAWRDKAQVYVTDGLLAGERVITSLIAAPVPDMRLEVADQ